MAFELLPLERADIPRCVDIYFAAFQNPHSLACWPRGVPAVRAWWEQMIADELDEEGAAWWKAVSTTAGSATGQAGGQIAAYAKWVAPKPGVEPDTALPQWPEGADAGLCDETFGAWARARRALMGDRGHWYLEMVATDPSFQGRGAGSQLMRWGLVRADADSVEAYLEASPDAVPLYEKLGFREVDRTETFISNERVEGVWYRNLFMIRPPAVKAGC